MTDPEKSAAAEPAAPAPAAKAAPAKAAPAPAAPPKPAGPITFNHSTQPDWGTALVVQDLGKHWVLFFEKAGEKKFVKELASKVLTEVKLDADALAALQARAHGRKPRAAPQTSAQKAKIARPKVKATAAPRFAAFKDQVALFEKIFPGGFNGETYLNDERGAPGATGKKAFKEGGIALAKAELSAAAFGSGSTDSLFESARKVLAATNIAHPLEGQVPFSALAGADREKAIAGLKDLLHGTAPYAERVERFVAALNLKDGDKAKKVTWPMATLFGALFDPAQHVCIKPTAFAGQAQTLGVAVDKTQAVNADGYGKFLEVAKKTEALLNEAGHKPRDLMDVYSFIYRTHAEKPATP